MAFAISALCHLIPPSVRWRGNVDSDATNRSCIDRLVASSQNASSAHVARRVSKPACSEPSICTSSPRHARRRRGWCGERCRWRRSVHRPSAIIQPCHAAPKSARHLRTGRALRIPRARTRGRGKTFISPVIMISQSPVEAADRAVPGHWKGDLILGLGSSAIAPWWSARRASPCCCTCRARRAMVMRLA
jgi:hypothetical protein